MNHHQKNLKTMTRVLSRESLTSNLNMGDIMRYSWSSWMGLRFMTIVDERKQESSTLNLASKVQEPYTSSQTTTYDLCNISFTSKWNLGTMNKLVLNQEWVSRSNQGQGRETRDLFPKWTFLGLTSMNNNYNPDNFSGYSVGRVIEPSHRTLVGYFWTIWGIQVPWLNQNICPK